ncbi:unnamed protein product, partial [Mesorhabditis belari]|uniref:RING-type domain-containing protein n=1 Tax=Mesorhabditis belari TaxID=2138241 RepID=A0AAF3ETX3_9BILA
MSLCGQCTICYSAFTPTTAFALPCGHTFHEHCIGQWLAVATARKGTEKLDLKEAELLQVRPMLHDVNETKSEKKVLKQLLEASDLALDAQKKKCREMAQELEVKNKRVSELEMEKKRLQEAVRTLNVARSHQGVTTAQNPKIKNLFALRSSNVDEFDKITAPKGPAHRVLPLAITSETMSFKDVMDGPSAVKTNNVSKSGSDGLGGSIHRLGDRALTRIENAPSSSLLVLGSSSLPFSSKYPAPAQPISEGLQATRQVFDEALKIRKVTKAIEPRVSITLD